MRSLTKIQVARMRSMVAGISVLAAGGLVATHTDKKIGIPVLVGALIINLVLTVFRLRRY